MLSLREAYREELSRLMMEDKRIVCLEADLGGHDNSIEKNFPSRFFNLGIAEHTLLNVSAGLAKEGFIPFASTFAPFAVLRACEAVKLSMGYMGLNIKLVAPYGGVSGAWFGTTHHCLEDFAILSSFPGIVIGAPHGEEETRAMVQFAHQYQGPVYLRLGRNGKYADLSYLDPLEYPKSRRVEGWSSRAEVVLVSVGEIGTALAVQLHHSLEEAGFSCNHLHLPFVDAKGRGAAVSVLKNLSRPVLILEEHRASTGVGVMLKALLADIPVQVLGANEEWISHGGSHEEILDSLGLSLKRIVSTAKNFLSRFYFKQGGWNHEKTYRVSGV